MKVKKQLLLDLLRDECEDPNYEVMVNEISDTGRWSIHYDFVFRHMERYFRAPYSVGATEQQDERPWEYEDDEVNVDEVKPTMVITTEYTPI